MMAQAPGTQGADRGGSQGASVRAVALFPLRRHFETTDGFEALLARHGLAPAQIEDSYEVIPLAAFLDLMEEAARQIGDPVLGARLGQQMSPADLGPAGLLTAQSSTIRRGLSRYCESISSLQSATEMRLSEADGIVDFTYVLNVPDADRWPQDAELTLSSTCRMIRAGFDLRWSPLEVHFMHGPSPRADLLRRIFRAPVKFRQGANRILFDAAGVDRSWRSEDEALIAVIERHVADLILAQDLSAGMTSRAQAVVARKLGRSPCTLATVAAELGIPPRRLQRRLAEEGTSLRAILRSHRQQLAERHLREPGRSLGEVADALGYSDGTVLWRAFRGWTGEAPSRRRRSPDRLR